MLQSKIRGLHATGAAFIENGNFVVHKAPLPADKFTKQAEWERFMAGMGLQAIFHTRYSTSGDWQENINNQPLALSKAALVHNGIVSMATKTEFEKAYRVRTTTSNDTEVILRFVNAYMKSGDSPEDAIYHALGDIREVEPPIFACGILTFGGELLCFRDHLRPLYRFHVPHLNMVGFCSTKDIFERAVRKSGLDRAQCKLYKCRPFVIYNVSTGAKREMSFSYPEDQKFIRPAGLGLGSDQSRIHSHSLACDGRSDLLPSPNRSTDFREERREGFIQYFAAQVLTDIDPAFPTMSELFDRYELSLEQRLWVAFLYTHFYENASVFLVMQEFPELEKVDVKRLQRWHDSNWKHLQYQTDRKWNKGHFVEQVVSYKNLIGHQTQHRFFAKLIVPGDPVASFNNCWEELHKVYKMGRHSVYAWTETLIRCVGLPIQCPSFYMDIAESSRNGLCYAIDRDDLVTKHDKKLSGPETGKRIGAAEIKFLENELERLMAEIRQRFPSLPVDYMLMETSCCAYKGLHRRRRYLGYYLDRMAMEIRRGETKMSTISHGVDWNTLWEIRSEIFIHEYLGERQNPPWFDIRHELCAEFMDTGHIVGLGPLQKRGLLETSSSGTGVCTR